MSQKSNVLFRLDQQVKSIIALSENQHRESDGASINKNIVSNSTFSTSGPNYTGDRQKKSNTPKLNWFTYDTGETENDLMQEEDIGIISNQSPQLFLAPTVLDISKDDNGFTNNFQNKVTNEAIYKHSIPLDITDRSNRYRICIFFLHQNERSKTFLWNRLAAFWTGSSIIHVEMYFEHDRTSCVVSSNCPVSFKRNKSYSLRQTRKAWECVTISLDAYTYDQVYQFCRREQGAPFDANSIYCFPLVPCFVENDDKRGWICSRLVVASFKQASIFPVEYDEKRFTPASVLKSLMNLPLDKKRDYSFQHIPIVE
jgi:hypothetical protein